MTESAHSAQGGDDVITLVGPFADRDAWTAQGWCSIERALEVVGTRSAMILLREVYYGANRFEDLVRRTGLSEAVTAGRLKQMVADELLTRRPYREPGARTRSEYVLTPRGRALFPVLVALMEWGESLQSKTGVEFVHAECGGHLTAEVHCERGHHVTLTQTQARLARFHDDARPGEPGTRAP
ncbi:winged helix-turn-helix transcriptional regulator [Sphaerisporangium corydalis]|uniref:Winged helix-turn-helix transcriptional regulator n=1 Tax=Sphaerisporangium corydalis TaxID=1441875 RepID=A0ABV9ENH4_9ACTN|nr:helix-turn-helix domain-containing protein [Sphaerisporangium corydalis]